MRMKNYKLLLHVVTDEDWNFYIKISEHAFIIKVQKYFSSNVLFGNNVML